VKRASLILLFLHFLNSVEAATRPTLTIEGSKIHPTVFLTPADVQRGRENIRRYAWAKEIAEAILREANAWLKREDAWLMSAVPAPGSAFAYGITGCPICGASWGPFGRDGASFLRPREVTCKNGHTLPDKNHPDPGTGYIAPDGRIHYFIGTYNAWVVETLTFKALENLVCAYTLTGDERYAVKAAFILDALAAIYPECRKGCWDYPSDPLSGRLDRPWYQASRMLIHYVDQYDQLYNSKSLETPSVKPGLTKRQNIENNLLMDGGEYCYEESKAGRLHNGEADYERGALAVGVCLGIPEYVRWAAEGPFGIFNLLENNISRDGAYFEVTPLYADHTRELYFTFAELLLNYRGRAYPEGLDLYQSPIFRQFMLPHNLTLQCAGHIPRYGDAPPDLLKRPGLSRPFDRSDYDFMEKLFARTNDPAQRLEAGTILNWLSNGRLDDLRGLKSTGDPTGLFIPDRRISAGFSAYRDPGDPLGGGLSDRIWMLFHAGEAPKGDEPLPAEWMRRLTASSFLGQKGFAVLRAGEGQDAQGLVLRFGPALNHSHLDDLNINYFARGYELTYDLGYGFTAATHTQAGWASQTASHNLIVVDETSQMKEAGTGGSLYLFADLPSVKVAEASSESSLAAQGVSVYRRLNALIGQGKNTYLLDIFRVRGGRQHDWIFHTPSTKVDFSGVPLGPEEKGSLAGPDISWSGKQLNDGDIQGHPNAPYWIPPPGNGYGFLSRPRRGRADTSWSANWTIDQATQVQVIMPATPGTEVITAVASGVYPDYPKAQYVLARRRGEHLASEYVAVVEPYAGTPSVREIERISLGEIDSPIVPVAVKIKHDEGTIDYVISTDDDLRRKAEDISFAGRFAHVRIKAGKLFSISLVGSEFLAGFGWEVKPKVNKWSGRIASVDFEKNAINTETPLPVDGSFNNQVIVFSNPVYSRTTAYRIVRVEKDGRGRRVLLDGTPRLGKGNVEALSESQEILSLIPHEYAISVSGAGDTGFFRGKRITTISGVSTRVSSVRTGKPMVLTVQNLAGFKPGDVFYYEDLQPGDDFAIMTIISLIDRGKDEYQMSGNCDATITAPKGVQIKR